MNKDQENILNMYEAGSDVLHNHEPVWSGNVPFSEAVQEEFYSILCSML